jgi:hypothetical protein
MYKEYKDGEGVDSVITERIKKLEGLGFVWSLAPGDEEAGGSSSHDGEFSRHKQITSNHPAAKVATKGNDRRHRKNISSSLVDVAKTVNQGTQNCSVGLDGDGQKQVFDKNAIDVAAREILQQDGDAKKQDRSVDRLSGIIHLGGVQDVSVDHESTDRSGNGGTEALGRDDIATAIDDAVSDYDGASHAESDETDDEGILVI